MGEHLGLFPKLSQRTGVSASIRLVAQLLDMKKGNQLPFPRAHRIKWF